MTNHPDAVTAEGLAALSDQVRKEPGAYAQLPEPTARLVAIVLLDEQLLDSRFNEDLETLLRNMDAVTRTLCLTAQDIRARQRDKPGRL